MSATENTEVMLCSSWHNRFSNCRNVQQMHHRCLLFTRRAWTNSHVAPRLRTDYDCECHEGRRRERHKSGGKPGPVEIEEAGWGDEYRFGDADGGMGPRRFVRVR